MLGDVHDLEALTLRDLVACACRSRGLEKLVQRVGLVVLQKSSAVLERSRCKLGGLKQLCSACIDVRHIDAVLGQPMVCLVSLLS